MSLETAFCENTAAALRCGQHPQEGGREQKLNSLSLAWSGFAQVGKDYKVHFADRLPEALGRALALVQKLLHGNILFPNSQMSKWFWAALRHLSTAVTVGSFWDANSTVCPCIQGGKPTAHTRAGKPAVMKQRARSTLCTPWAADLWQDCARFSAYDKAGCSWPLEAQMTRWRNTGLRKSKASRLDCLRPPAFCPAECDFPCLTAVVCSLEAREQQL